MSPSFAMGFRWLRDAVTLVRKRPLIFFSFAMSWFAINVLLGLIPVIGALFPLLLTPLMAPTYLLTCSVVERNEPAQASMLFTAFKGGMNNGHLPSLLAIGVFNTIWTLGSIAASRLADGGLLWSILLGQTPFSGIQENQFEALTSGIMPTTALYFIGYWIQWFSPALVFWKRMPAAKALGVSLFAVLRYWKSVLGYIVAISLLTIIVTLLINVLTRLLTPSIGVLLNMLYFTAMLIFFQAAAYVSFKQVFSVHAASQGGMADDDIDRI